MGSTVCSTSPTASTCIQSGHKTNTSAKMMKFTVFMVLLAVAAVQSKKYYGGCVGSICGGAGLAYGGIGLAAPVAAVAAPVAVAVPVAVAAPVAHVAVAAAPVAAVGYGYGIGGGLIDTLSGCGGYARLGYCGRSYYATGCARTCGLYKKK